MTGRPAARRDYPLTDADFATIAGLAREAFGLHLEASKRQLVYARLSKRLRYLGLEAFADYCDVLQGPVGAEERREMLSALTTNVTQFFREAHHFDQLARDVLPGLAAKARAGRRVRLWSAGCSAGQEAYSIALTILAHWPEAGRHDLRVLATDVDPVILRRAVAGRYGSEERAAIPAAMRGNVIEEAEGGFCIGPAARALVSFGELNLMDRWPMRGPFDVIFCRNVAIYFDAPTQAKLWKRYADLLAADGHLMIGHSERVTGPATASLQPCGVTAYRKGALATGATTKKTKKKDAGAWA